MKATADLILTLQHAKKARRGLDADIARAIGYTQNITWEQGPNGEKVRKVEWVAPEGLPHKIPLYTSSIEDARALSLVLNPNSTGGFTWSNGRATAQVNDSAIFNATTPALAICAAALSAKFHPQ